MFFFETGLFKSIGRRTQHDLTFPSLDTIGSSTLARGHGFCLVLSFSQCIRAFVRNQQIVLSLKRIWSDTGSNGGVSRIFQGYFLGVSRVLQERLKKISVMFQRVFQGCSKGGPLVF